MWRVSVSLSEDEGWTHWFVSHEPTLHNQLWATPNKQPRLMSHRSSSPALSTRTGEAPSHTGHSASPRSDTSFNGLLLSHLLCFDCFRHTRVLDPGQLGTTASTAANVENNAFWKYHSKAPYVSCKDKQQHLGAAQAHSWRNNRYNKHHYFLQYVPMSFRSKNWRKFSKCISISSLNKTFRDAPWRKNTRKWY